MKKTLLLLSILLLLLTGCASTPSVDEMPAYKYKKGNIDATIKDDGYAYATLDTCLDGDTAIFEVNGLDIITRFLAIDTPETSHPTIGLEPWGNPAKNYTCDKLTNATEIIIETDPESDIFDHYDRLLGWIWVDGELLNYDLVENGYAYVKYLYGDYAYTENFIVAEKRAREQEIRVHGEVDETYDYSEKVEMKSIAEAKNMQLGKKVQVEGLVTSVIGQNFFVEQDGAAIYVYANKYSYKISAQVGNKISFVADVSTYKGQTQLANIEDKKIEVLSEGNELPEPIELSVTDAGAEYEGRVVVLKDVVVKSVDADTSNGYSVVVDQQGETFTVRIDKYVDPMIDANLFTVGNTYNITGAISKYNDSYQLLVRSEDDIRSSN